jgi:alkaline phosphatase
MVADGMSIGAFTLADIAIRRQTGRGSAWIDLWARPGVRRSLVSTRAADSIVTDSAAGGSAWGCGRRLNNGAINWHEGVAFEPILVSARNAGKATGLVTTTRVTHATPASFAANVPTRNMEAEIATQLLDRRIDLILGGGAKFLTPELLAEHADLAVVRNAGELRGHAHTPGRLVGLFSPDHMAYDRDRADDQPSLREMSLLALERLALHPSGFVLQIEGGRVDHGAHANDIVATLFDQIAFDEAVRAVSHWAEQRGDTLMIVTTDHGTGGPEFSRYEQQSHECLDRLLGARHTLSWIGNRIGETRHDDPAAMFRDLAREHLDATLSDEQTDWLRRALAGERTNAFDGANSLDAAVAAVMANHLGVGWVSTDHTAEHVDATAVGPGAEALPPRVENYELHRLVTAALGLRVP